MSEEMIKQIVNATISELMERDMIQYDEDMVYKFMGKKLSDHFEGRKDLDIASALEQIKDDEYANIINLYYEEKNTINEVAYILDVDPATVARNKKRLVLRIYNLIYT